MPAGIDQMQQWWEGLDDAQRDRFRSGIKDYPLDPQVMQLLFDTNCPALPDSATDAPEGVTMGMPAEVAEIINGEKVT